MRKTIVGLLLATLAASTGCDAISQAESSQVMFGEILASPAETIAGQTVASNVVASVFLGTRNATNPTGQPTPTTGATVTVAFNGITVPVPEVGNGNYSVNTVSSTTLAYVVGATYTFTAVVGTTTFSETVIAPERETIVEFHQGLLAPDAGTPQPLPDGGIPFPFVPVTANTDLTLTRAPSDGPAGIALTIVAPVTSAGVQDPSFTNPGLDGTSLLTLVLDPSAYETPTVTIDGTKAWPVCPPSDYLLTVTSLAQGSTVGNNLFVGSTAFAGTADAAPGHCQ